MPVKDYLFDDRDATNDYAYINNKRKHLNWEPENRDDGYSNNHFRRQRFGTFEKGIQMGKALLYHYLPVLRLPLRNLTISFSTKGNSWASSVGGRQLLNISVSVFNDFTIKESNRLDIFLGEVIHESAHILYTDFPYFAVVRNNINETEKSIINIVEDERIERCIGDNYPGYSRYLSKLKNYYFDKLYIEKYKAQEEVLMKRWLEHDKSPKSLMLMNFLLKLVRYPKHINKGERRVFNKFFKGVTEILKEYPETFADVVITSSEIYKLFEEQVQQDAAKFAMEDMASEKGNEQLSDADRELQTASKIVAYSEAIETDVRSISNVINEVFSTGHEKDAVSDIDIDSLTAITIHDAEKELNNFLSQDVEFGTDMNIRFTRAFSDSTTDVRRLLTNNYGAIASFLKREHRDQKLTLQGMRSGTFDTAKIAEAAQGVDTVYKRFTLEKSEKISVVLLIDASSSMGSGYSTTKIPKVLFAKAVGMTFFMALSKVPDVDLFIYSYSSEAHSPDSTEIKIHAERGFRNINNFGSIHADNYTHEGVAIHEVAQRVRKFTDYPCIFFVVSDGQPEGTKYSGSKAVEHTRDTVYNLEKKGFDIIHIAIDSDALTKQKAMYRHAINFTSVSDLPMQVSRLAKKLIKKRITPKISYNV